MFNKLTRLKGCREAIHDLEKILEEQPQLIEELKKPFITGESDVNGRNLYSDLLKCYNLESVKTFLEGLRHIKKRRSNIFTAILFTNPSYDSIALFAARSFCDIYLDISSKTKKYLEKVNAQLPLPLQTNQV